MISIVLVGNIPSAVSRGARLIIMSADSQKALMESVPQDIAVESTYDDSELSTLLNQESWKQPCIDCGEA